MRKDKGWRRATVRAITRAVAWGEVKAEFTTGRANARVAVMSSDTTVSERGGWFMKEDACDRTTARPKGIST